jgi:hypothetical protein
MVNRSSGCLHALEEVETRRDSERMSVRRNQRIVRYRRVMSTHFWISYMAHAGTVLQRNISKLVLGLRSWNPLFWKPSEINRVFLQIACRGSCRSLARSSFNDGVYFIEAAASEAGALIVGNGSRNEEDLYLDAAQPFNCYLLAALPVMSSEKPSSPSALWYALNAREYELLNHYVIEKLHRRSKKTAARSEPQSDKSVLNDDYHSATIRTSVRVFLGTAAGLKAWELITTFLLARGTSKR